MSEWIAISERLPDDNAYYWVVIRIFSNEYRYVDSVRWEAGAWEDDEAEFRSDEVTHWMPIVVPDLPKEPA